MNKTAPNLNIIPKMIFSLGLTLSERGVLIWDTFLWKAITTL